MVVYRLYRGVLLAEGLEGRRLGLLDLGEQAHTHGARDVVSALAARVTARDAAAVGSSADAAQLCTRHQ